MKKTYYIPTMEVIALTPGWPVLIAGSDEHGSGPHHVPKRREKVF